MTRNSRPLLPIVLTHAHDAVVLSSGRAQRDPCADRRHNVASCHRPCRAGCGGGSPRPSAGDFAFGFICCRLPPGVWFHLVTTLNSAKWLSRCPRASLAHLPATHESWNGFDRSAVILPYRTSLCGRILGIEQSAYPELAAAAFLWTGRRQESIHRHENWRRSFCVWDPDAGLVQHHEPCGDLTRFEEL